MIELQGLNSCQEQAVKSVDGPVMVLAGAGSGKTRVLTNRIAYMVKEAGVNPDNILAITFTNKAANEMKHRLFEMLNGNMGRMLVSTIHSMCTRILRFESESLKDYSPNFSIYTASESEHVMKTVVKKIRLSEEEAKLNFLYHSGAAKNEAFSFDEYYNECLVGNANGDIILEVLKAYEKQLKSCNAMDFDDLLYNCYLLFRDNAEILEKYRRRFKYVSIDEFQDTNRVQYLLFKLMAKEHGNIFIVGDDDQSIYGWRGADTRNLFDFKKDFPDTKIIKLEQNYRSTKNILSVANKIIEKNSNRYEKKLWTENDDGDVVKTYIAQSENEEAYYVVSQIAALIKEGYRQKDIAVLMRMNATSRAFEQEFTKYNINYKVFGGYRFFERKEIKDIISYLRLIDNPYDNEAFLRVVNFPRRGLGEKTISEVIKRAESCGISALEAAGEADSLLITSVARVKLKAFYELIKELREMSCTADVLTLTEELYKRIDLRRTLEEGGDPEKALYADEFLQASENFVKENPGGVLCEFLQSVSLQSDIDSMDESNYVTIATVHSAKGLEFSVVFVIGVENGIFPLSRAMYDAEELNEERRLMYVALTRAMKKLYVTRCESRFLHGERKMMSASMFFKEIDNEVNPRYMNKGMYDNEFGEEWKADKVKQKTKVKDNSVGALYAERKEKRAAESYTVGTKIVHKNFGIGVVVASKNDNIDVAFNSIGVKTLSVQYAPIKKLEN